MFNTGTLGLAEKALEQDKVLVTTGLETLGFPYLEWGTRPFTKSLDQFIKDWIDDLFEWDPESPSDTLHFDVVSVAVQYHINGRVFQLRRKLPKSAASGKTLPIGPQTTFSWTMKHTDTPRTVALQELKQTLGKIKNGFKDTRRFTLDFSHASSVGPLEYPAYHPFKAIYHNRSLVCVIEVTDESLYSELYEYDDDGETITLEWFEVL